MIAQLAGVTHKLTTCPACLGRGVVIREFRVIYTKRILIPCRACSGKSYSRIQIKRTTP